MNHDPINRPSHYAEGRKFEPIDVIEDWELLPPQCSDEIRARGGAGRWRSRHHKARAGGKSGHLPLEALGYASDLLEEVAARLRATDLPEDAEEIRREAAAFAMACGSHAASRPGVSRLNLPACEALARRILDAS